MSITGLFPPWVLRTNGVSWTSRGFTAERIWRSGNDLRPAKHVLQRPFVWLRHIKKSYVTHFSPLFLLLYFSFSASPTHTLSFLSQRWLQRSVSAATDSIMMRAGNFSSDWNNCFWWEHDRQKLYIRLPDLNTNSSNTVMFELNGVTLLMKFLSWIPPPHVVPHLEDLHSSSEH